MDDYRHIQLPSLCELLHSPSLILSPTNHLGSVSCNRNLHSIHRNHLKEDIFNVEGRAEFVEQARRRCRATSPVDVSPPHRLLPLAFNCCEWIGVNRGVPGIAAGDALAIQTGALPRCPRIKAAILNGKGRVPRAVDLQPVLWRRN